MELQNTSDADRYELQLCSVCIYDETIAGISFDLNGVCNYCKQILELKEKYLLNSNAGEVALNKIISEIKLAGKNKMYDCVVGVSGGTDSSYLLMKAKDWGLRPLAVHYDNTWNTALASRNIRLVTSALDVDLHTFVVDNIIVDDIKLAFLKSGVREFDADTDIAFVQVLRSAAAKYRIKYILEGHSFLTEGLTPTSTNYLDGRYVEDVHRNFGTINSRAFPNMKFWSFMKWSLLYRQKFIRPLWYLPYDKEKAQSELAERTGWVNYKGHHLENKASSFAHTVWLPKRFGIDYRILTLSANVREGRLQRDIALKLYRSPINVDIELIEYVKKRLFLDDQTFATIMLGPIRSWRDFRTYKRRFEILKPLFFLMASANLVPMSFYLKYCRKMPV